MTEKTSHPVSPHKVGHPVGFSLGTHPNGGCHRRAPLARPQRRVGMRHTTTHPITPATSTTACTIGRSASCQAETPTIKTIIPEASHLMRKGMLRWASQSRTIGPSQRCCTNQLCRRGEAWAKQAAGTAFDTSSGGS